ncbi:sensor histidine kinase [Nocardioides sp. SR21]|uniref:sensor histidine kinase n=1 Tax=Nocardioides sp. SR21 TaxID=2919501 RepID=UPI001FAAAAE2|nr:sensor histidine kinase [Nocardioides sp. SR21]
MARTAQVLVIVAAWAIPVVWIGAELGTRPSDGTVVWSSPVAGGDEWGSAVTVRRTYGDSLLLPGDVLLSIDGRPLDHWLAGETSSDVSVGETIRYHVRRVEDGSPREYDRTVTVTHFPLGRALVADLPQVLVALLLLVAGSVAFYLRPGLVAARAFLGFASLVPIGLASSPWGLGALDLAGGRGYWPHVVAQVVFALGLGLAVLAAATLPTPRGWLSRHPWVVPAALALPFAGYAVWVAAVSTGEEGAARTQALLAVAAPALVVVVPAALAVLIFGYLRASSRDTRLATRLALMVLTAGLGLLLLLGVLPERVVGDPVLPFDVLMLLVVPPILAGVVVALVGYRLDVIEPNVRRAVVQGAVAAVFGTAFVVVAATVGRAADVSVGSILAGGVAALVVLPLAVALQRRVRHVVFGDRELPRSVVAELRRLDSSTAPSEALTETLSVLCRRLHLSHAAIQLPGTDGPALASYGEPSGGGRVVVDLVASGATIGSLHLETHPLRDPFGRGDRRLLEDVGAQVGALVQAVLANRELQRSRQALVTAREEERRRLRRDLHDGLGPSLATMMMRLESAQELIATDPDQAAVALGGLADLAHDDIAEVRRLVEGLRPGVLDQLGLVSALRQRAAQHEQAAGGHGLAWRVEAEEVEPLPAAVEVAAYRIVLEAVTNAVRHSHARECVVTLRRDDAQLRVRIGDDGVGMAEGRPAGVGLSSMRERAEELGGTCTVASDGRGTVVEALLPLRAGEDS